LLLNCASKLNDKIKLNKNKEMSMKNRENGNIKNAKLK
jgi:hypothetical protein